MYWFYFCTAVVLLFVVAVLFEIFNAVDVKKMLHKYIFYNIKPVMKWIDILCFIISLNYVVLRKPVFSWSVV